MDAWIKTGSCLKRQQQSLEDKPSTYTRTAMSKPVAEHVSEINSSSTLSIGHKKMVNMQNLVGVDVLPII